MAADEESPLERLSDQGLHLWSFDDEHAASRGSLGFGGLDRPLRTIAACDFDRDGDPDLVVGGLGTHRVELLENLAGSTGANHYVRLRLQANDSARCAIGALVRVHTTQRSRATVVGSVGAFGASGPPELLFGLESATVCDVDVLWPGKRQFETYTGVGADRTWLLVEGRGKAHMVAEREWPLAEALPFGVKLTPAARPYAWPLLDRGGERVELDFATDLETTNLFLVSGERDVDWLDFERDGRSYALALGPKGWSSDVLESLPEHVAPLSLNWNDPDDLKVVDPFLDLYSLELPTTLRFDAEGRLLSARRELRPSGSSSATR